jgi:hypothetical protein
MILNKKAIGSSIIIMLVFSLILSFLLFTILNVTFSDRHEFCQNVNMDVRAVCENRNEEITLSIRNDGSINMYYEINEILDSEVQVLLPNSLEEIKIEQEDTYKVVPYVKGEDEKLYACVAQMVFVPAGGDLEKC